MITREELGTLGNAGRRCKDEGGDAAPDAPQQRLSVEKLRLLATGGFVILP